MPKKMLTRNIFLKFLQKQSQIGEKSYEENNKITEILEKYEHKYNIERYNFKNYHKTRRTAVKCKVDEDINISKDLRKAYIGQNLNEEKINEETENPLQDIKHKQSITTSQQ